jgi:hypothetical protein
MGVMTEPTNDAQNNAADEVLDEYLNRLLAALAGRGDDVRRTMAEAESHLRDAVEAGTHRGLTPEDAARVAVANFGTPGQVARARGLSIQPWVATGRAAHLLAAVGLVAIGLSGLVAELFFQVWGPFFVAGDAPGVTYTPARCDQYFALAPSGDSCLEAAAIHHSAEVIEPRVGAGLLGLLILGTWLWSQRRRRRQHVVDPTSPLIAAAAGTAMFGVAACALLLDGFAMLALGSRYGAGAGLSAGLVSAVVCLGWAVLLWHELPARQSGASLKADRG